MRNVRILFLVLFCVVLAGCGIIPASHSVVAVAYDDEDLPPLAPSVQPSLSSPPEPTALPGPSPTPAPEEISIMAVGDIMFHRRQIDAAYDKATQTYDFHHNFVFIRDILTGADLALGNFECTLAGPERPYSVHAGKSFSAPDTAADALKHAGFDVLSTVNNHYYDRGASGVQRTLGVLSEAGIVCVGTRKDTSEPPYHIAEVNGIRLGIAAYSSSRQNDALACLFSYSDLDKSLAAMGETAAALREKGAQIVIFFMHWGNEYARQPSQAQIALAQGLCDSGVDIILGSHPHVLQPVDLITSDLSGRSTLVAYSLGNFISNQRTKYDPKFTYTEDSVILDIRICKPHDGQPYVAHAHYLPIWTMLDTVGGHKRYAVLPVEKALASPEAYGLTASYNQGKAQKALDHTNALLADAVEKGFLSLLQLD